MVKPEVEHVDREQYKNISSLKDPQISNASTKPTLRQFIPFFSNRQYLSNVFSAHSSLKKLSTRFWERLSLRTKATTAAIAISSLPILALGAMAYQLSSKNITDSVTQQQQTRAISLANQLEQFIAEGYKDIQTLSQLGVISNLRTNTSISEQQALLEQYIKNNQGYDSIIFTDISGRVILRSSGEVITNYSDVDYFKQVMKTNRPVITPPRKSLATGEYRCIFAAPVLDPATGKTVGMVRSRVPLKYFNEVIQVEAKELVLEVAGFNSEKYFAINDVGKVVLASPQYTAYIGKEAQLLFPKATAQLPAVEAVNSLEEVDQLEQDEYLVSYAPIRKIAPLPELKWSVMVAQPTAEIFVARRGLLLTFVTGIGVKILLVSALAALLINRALRPVIEASTAVQKLEQGQLDTRISIEGKDEIAVLGSNINLMAEKLQLQIQKQEEIVERSQLLTDIILRIRKSLNIEDILKTAVKEVRRVLKTDRVVIYRFNPDLSGTIVAESVATGWTSALSETIADPCFQECYFHLYKDGRVRAVDDIYQAGLNSCYISSIERFEVKANLIAPIQKNNQLLGLLITHQCSKARIWQQFEIELFTNLAIQIGFAVDQASLLEQVEKARSAAEALSQEQRQQKEALQSQLVELLSDVEAATSGDLTVRAEVVVGEIGTVADFFNAIIESLREIVISVKTAAEQVDISVGKNEEAMHQLAEQAVNQVAEITRILDSVDQMTLSIQSVANNARLAAEVAHTAHATAETGEAAMDSTVQSILGLRHTVTKAANKVKRLGESSQQISKVVTLIQQIALQTNVLAINTSIEAARAGEEGRGFALVAEEVARLAAKSAAATAEIEQVVADIQQETSEVIRAMELGNTQAIAGADLVESAKQSLEQILNVSRQIDELVQSVSVATVTQAQMSVSVTNLMKDIAQASEYTSDSSHQISGSLQQTVELAKQLQASVGKFKVNT